MINHNQYHLLANTIVSLPLNSDISGIEKLFKALSINSEFQSLRSADDLLLKVKGECVVAKRFCSGLS